MKYLYVCTSSSEDFFLEQTFVSIVSLRAHTPNAFVSLIIDKCTEKSLVNGRENIKKIVNEFIVVNLDEGLSAKYRSRLLKSSMRNLIEGDFLFIDSDTVILDNLSKIDEVSFDFAGVLDCHSKLSDNPQKYTHKKQMLKLCKEQSFLDSEEYINSGVLLVRDTTVNRSFFEQWNDLYKKSFKQHCISQDQPTLALVNFENNNIIEELDGSWNCQLSYGASFFRSAKIFHFIASTNIPISMQNLYSKVRQLLFEEQAVLFIKEKYEKAAFDFGKVALLRGNEYKILHTALYRLLIFLFLSHFSFFSFFERIASLGRGHGFYMKSKN